MGYCQIFRNGIIEAVDADLVRDLQGAKFIPSGATEQQLVQAIGSYLSGLRELGVPLPIVLSTTMIGVRGARMYESNSLFGRERAVPIDREVVVLPDLVVEEKYPKDIPAFLRPVFDAAWNASGQERSFSFNESGVWSPR